ncbi:MAG: endopeptidase La [Bacilli bacterium]|nr:endopeptidase La [Bacilli bacterium]
MFSNDTIDTYSIPIIVVKNIIPLPNNEIKFDVLNPVALAAIKAASQTKKYVGIFLPKNPLVENYNFSNIQPVGVVCELSYFIEGGTSKAKMLGIVRARLNAIEQETPYLVGNVTSMPKFSEDTSAELTYVKILVSEIEKNGTRILGSNRDIITLISQGVTPDKLTDILAFNMKLDIASKLKYLQTPSITMRLRFLVEDIKREKQLAEIDMKIEDDVRKSINDSQKEYYLREKMKAIQNELGDKARKESDVEELRKRILECKMPEDVEKRALNELNRYATLGTGSGEASIARSYLDFMVSLPWNKESQDNKDIKIAKDQLDSDHFGLETVKERILEYLAVRIMTNKTPQAILCLVGPPGVGKTSLARSIAAALNKKFVKQALGGVKDESEIRGHRRTYLGALPGRILQGMKKAGTNNPVFLLDEVDKLSSDFRGDPSSALLEVLDAEQNKFFSDHYLEESYDLSHVFFIATANYLENVPAPLRDRMEIVEVSSYTEYEKYEIAKRHLIDKQLFTHGLSKCDFELTDGALWRIIREYTKEAGVRELERTIGTLVRKAIKTILMNKNQKIIIDENNITEWIGKPKFVYNKVDVNPQVGVVTGLAYTQYGGDTLPVEVTYYQGQGKIVLTGKLGDVMKESAQAALSYVRSNAKLYGIDEELFLKNDIHIHVPEGAVPKDGPSAGVTMATGIVSAFSHRLVNNQIGMTGEITLRGRVLPIGGLREKSIAAHRSGLKTIIIPKENVRDLDEIPQSVREELEIIPVEKIEEVVKIALI